MALTKNVNSYADVAEAEVYFEDRLDVAAWSEATATQKAQALVTATSLLNELAWAGVAVDVSQPLAFPRYGEYFDPRIGTLINFGDSVPQRIITATYELAYHLLNNDGQLDSTGSVKSLSLGNIELQGIQASPDFPKVVKRFIKPMLINAGASLWWRAN